MMTMRIISSDLFILKLGSHVCKWCSQTCTAAEEILLVLFAFNKYINGGNLMVDNGQVKKL